MKIKNMIFALAALLAVSCAEELDDPKEITGPSDENLVSITFEASAPVTKTTVDETGDVKWEQGDKIAVYYWNASAAEAGKAEAKAASAGDKTVFTIQIPQEAQATEFWAVHPSTQACTLSNADGDYSFVINMAGKYDGSFNSANISAAKSIDNGDGTYRLGFKNATGVIKYKIGEKYPEVTGLTFRAVNGEKMWGDITVAFDAEGEMTCTSGTNGNGNIQLSHSLSAAGNEYYVPVLPGVTMSQGFVAKLTKSSAHIPGACSEKETTVGKGVIYNLGTIEDHIIADYYISPDGTGDGKSEGSPADWSLLKTMMPKGTTQAQNLILDGVTFHLLAGTYEPATYVELQFNANWKPYVTFKGAGIGDAGTILKATAERLFIIRQNSNLKFEDIKFTGEPAKTYDNQGNIVLVNGSNSGETLSATFENCLFDTNIAKAGAISAFKGDCTLKCVGCQFTNNKGVVAGAILGLEQAKVYLNDCYFYENYVDNNAMCVYMNGAATVFGANNCSFRLDAAKTPANGSMVASKGYSVVVNSTIFGKLGQWGSWALGCSINNNEKAGNLLLNDIIINLASNTAYKGIYDHINYYTNVRYGMYTSANGTTNLTVEDAVSGVINTNMTGRGWGTEASGAKYLKWSGLTDIATPITRPSQAAIRQAIKDVPVMGADFLSWLESLEDENGCDALEVDAAGNVRSTRYVWPGAYEGAETPNEDASDPVELRIGTFNCRVSTMDDGDNSWINRQSRLLSSIKNNDYDILGVQECDKEIQNHLTTNTQLSDYTCKFFDPYENTYNPRSHGLIYKTADYTLSDWNTFWLSEGGASDVKVSDNDVDTDGNTYTRGGCSAILTHNSTGAKVFVMVTHGCLGDEKYADIYEAVEKEQNPDGYPSFFIGDMNASPSNAASVTYRDYWFDAFQRAAKVTGPVGTFNGFDASKDPAKRIDYIYFRGAVDAVEYVCDDTMYDGGFYPSDHCPVYADMKVYY